MKKLIILLSILVMMCALVACGKEEEPYDAESAVADDNSYCSTIKNVFNASLTIDAAFEEVIKGSDSIRISVDEDGEIVFTSSGTYTNLEEELECCLADFRAPKEKGKSAYCITWEADGKKVSNIKVETVE